MNRSVAQFKTAILIHWVLAGMLLLPALAQAELQMATGHGSGQPVGTQVRWYVFDDADTTAFDYGLMVYRGTPGNLEALPRVLYDVGAKRAFNWTPLQEGTYTVLGVARHQTSGQYSFAQQQFDVLSRVSDKALVTNTAHSLVALFSAPPCPVGHTIRVNFFTVLPTKFDVTMPRRCDGESSTNLYLGGMLAETQYYAFSEERDENDLPVAYGTPLGVTTGRLPDELAQTFPTRPADENTSVDDDVILSTPLTITTDDPIPVASDLWGRILWYYDDPETLGAQIWRPIGGGKYFVNHDVDGVKQQGLREIDLLGNVLRETTVRRLAQQLPLVPGEVLSSIHHEAVRLPNGHTAILVSTERLLSDVQGHPGEVDVIADGVVVLDRFWQVAWYWSAFDHLDIERVATLNKVCGNEPPQSNGCPPVLLVDGITTFANDWTHANSIGYSPTDGHLIISLRHQDWVVKIDYADGAGTGEVVWRLGLDGDFSIDSNDPYPWMSHQHDANYISENEILLYDNGNVRCDGAVGPCRSRGQVYELDETAMTSSLVLNADVGSYAFAVGSAQLLSNGNFHFHSGVLQTPEQDFYTEIVEVLPDGSLSYSVVANQPSYRSFRLFDLYRVPGDERPRLFPLAAIAAD